MSPNVRLLIAVALVIISTAIWYFSFGPYKERVEQLRPTPAASSAAFGYSTDPS